MKGDWEINEPTTHAVIQLDELEKQQPFPQSIELTMSSWEPNRSTAFLDGLRGLAAFLVFIYHFNVGWYGERILHGYGEHNEHYSFTLFPFIRTFYTGGIAAVAIFFVLSGFVLTISPLRKIRDKTAKQTIYRSVISSVIRRPVRLYLPCLMVVWTSVIIRHTPLLPAADFLTPKDPVGLEIITATGTFIKFFNPLRQHSFTIPFSWGLHYWTIPIELKGSLLVFAMTAYSVEEVSPRRDFLRHVLTGLLFHQMGQWTMSLFIAGMCLAMCETYNWNLTDLRMFRDISSRANGFLNGAIFIVGWWLCSQVDRNVEWSSATPGWYILGLLIPRAYTQDEFPRYWVGFGAVMMVYSILRISLLQRFFALRPLMWLGKISFVLYLTHTVVMLAIGDYCRRIVGQPTFIVKGDMGSHWYDNMLYMPDIGPMGLNMRWFGCFLLTTPPCLVVAHFTMDFYDRTGMRVAKWLARKCGYDR